MNAISNPNEDQKNKEYVEVKRWSAFIDEILQLTHTQFE